MLISWLQYSSSVLSVPMTLAKDSYGTAISYFWSNQQAHAERNLSVFEYCNKFDALELMLTWRPKTVSWKGLDPKLKHIFPKLVHFWVNYP